MHNTLASGKFSIEKPLASVVSDVLVEYGTELESTPLVVAAVQSSALLGISDITRDGFLLTVLWGDVTSTSVKWEATR